MFFSSMATCHIRRRVAWIPCAPAEVGIYTLASPALEHTIEAYPASYLQLLEMGMTCAIQTGSSILFWLKLHKCLPTVLLSLLRYK